MDLTRKLGRVHSNAVSENLASFQPTYNTATNQFATLPAATPTYDANGQLTYDGFHDYQWDADGNLASLDNGTVVSTYDALGRRVEQVPSSGASTQMVWDPVEPFCPEAHSGCSSMCPRWATTSAW